MRARVTCHLTQAGRTGIGNEYMQNIMNEPYSLQNSLEEEAVYIPGSVRGAGHWGNSLH